MKILSLISRDTVLFNSDLHNNDLLMSDLVSNNRVLVIGGSGTIGQAVSKEIFKRDPKALHVVDISENKMMLTLQLAIGLVFRLIFLPIWLRVAYVYEPGLTIFKIFLITAFKNIVAYGKFEK